MKYKLLLIILLTLLSSTSFAFLPPIPTGYIVDLTGKMSQNQVQKLNQKLTDYENKSSNQIAALILNDMGGESIEDVAYKTFNTWKIGKAEKDNGVLVVIAVKERKSRIETGKGIGDKLTDLQSNDILRFKLNPKLKVGNFYGGLNDTFDAITEALDVENTPAPLITPVISKAATDSSKVFAGVMVFGSLIIAFGIIIAIFISNKKQKSFNRKLQESNRNYKGIKFQYPLYTESVYQSSIPKIVEIPNQQVSQNTYLTKPKKPIEAIKPIYIGTGAPRPNKNVNVQANNSYEQSINEKNSRDEEDRIRARQRSYESSYSSSSSSFDWSSGTDSGGFSGGGGESGSGGSSSNWD